MRGSTSCFSVGGRVPPVFAFGLYGETGFGHQEVTVVF